MDSDYSLQQQIYKCLVVSVTVKQNGFKHYYLSWNLEEGNILFEKLVDGRNEDKVGVSFGQWKGGLRKDSKMENVGSDQNNASVMLYFNKE